jgi:spectinomycin phosphotransferase
VEPIPNGQDDGAAVFALLDAAGRRRWVAKVRAPGQPDAGPALALSLHEGGVPSVVAPIRSVDGSPNVRLRRTALAIYPFVEGRTGADAGLTDAHWRSIGAAVRALHDGPAPAELAARLPVEAFRPHELDDVRRVDRAVGSVSFRDVVRRRIAAFWIEHRSLVLDLAMEAERRGDALRRRGLPMVVTHGDLHTWNVMVDLEGMPWIVDWDEVALAPKERDLMFFVGGIRADLVPARATANFFEGYGDATVDPEALSYFRHAWAIQDIGSYAARALLERGLAAPARAESASILEGLFRPGEIVELALASRTGSARLSRRPTRATLRPCQPTRSRCRPTTPTSRPSRSRISSCAGPTPRRGARSRARR